MIKEILKAAKIPARPAAFRNCPSGTYGIYFDSKDADGSDDLNLMFTHDCVVELYAPVIDDDAKAHLEAQLDARGIHYTTQGWYWLDSIQRYQEIYEFSYTTKF